MGCAKNAITKDACYYADNGPRNGLAIRILSGSSYAANSPSEKNSCQSGKFEIRSSGEMIFFFIDESSR